MPPRSVKMKRRIFGFQRRVWWPKWTPASSSSRMETTATGCSFRLSGAAAGGLGRNRRGAGTAARIAPPGRRFWFAEMVAAASSARPSARPLERLREVIRQRRRDVDPLAGQRVVECEASRVQELAPEPKILHAVDGIAGDRQLDRGEVDADLVHAAGLQ